MDANFNTLFNRYIENQTSPQEEEVLMALIREGAHRLQMEQSVDSVLQERIEFEMIEADRQEMKARILRHTHPPRPGIIALPAFWFAAAACLLVASVVGLWFYHEPVVQQNKLTGDHVYSGKNFILLPDSTTILLNENSELAYTYTKERREVNLIGEAFFEVAHDPRRPFYVRTGKLLTKVLGTSFSVRAYAEQKELMVAVTDGKVEVSDSDEARSYGVISPNEQLAVNPHTEAVVKTASKAPQILEWRDNFLVLNDVTLENAARLIHDRYDVKITFKNPDIANCQVNARFFDDEKVNTVLDIVTSALSLTYTIETNGDILIDGKGCQ